MEKTKDINCSSLADAYRDLKLRIVGFETVDQILFTNMRYEYE
jgi:hypothetical protein